MITPTLGLTRRVRRWKWLALLCCGSAGLSALSAEPAPDPTSVVIATVNGQPVQARELGLFIAWRKAGVAARFFPGEPAVGPVMWQRSVAGQSAADVLKAEALDDAVQAKLLQLLAIEHGLLADASWETFQRALAYENFRRAEALAAGAPIYGPRRFTERAFFRKRSDDLRLELARKFSRAEEHLSFEHVTALLAERRATLQLQTDSRALAALPIE